MKRLAFFGIFVSGIALAETLNVSVVGNGTVVSTPAGINCPGTCSANFTTGTSVLLTASPSQGYVFAKWLGDCANCGTDIFCNLTMNANRSCGAVFADVKPSPPIGSPPPTAPILDLQYRAFSGAFTIEATAQVASFSVGGSPGFSPPEGFTAPYGQISFRLNNVRAQETVRIILPRAIAPGSRVYKVTDSGIYDITSSVEMRGSTLTFFVYDNTWMDTDSTLGALRDPVVFLENQNPPAGGGGGCSTGAGAGIYGWIALLLSVLVRRLRG